MSTLADQTTRDIALDPARSFIVRAPAGSGKTELLTNRFLTLLGGVQCPEEIVAITFTRKAAMEMRARIIGALQSIVNGNAPNTTADRVRLALAKKVLVRDDKLDWRLQENPARLRIQTIDSLASRVAAEMPVLSTLGSVSNVQENAWAYYLEAARRSLRYSGDDKTWNQAINGLLLHLDNDITNAEKLLAMLLGHRDQWLRYLTDEALSRDMLDDAFHRTISATLTRVRELLPKAVELVDLLAEAAPNLPVLAECADLQELPPPEPGKLALWQAIVNVLLTANDDWRKSIDKRQGFLPNTEHKERMRDLLESYRTCDALRDMLVLVRALPAAEVDSTGRLMWFHEARWQTLQHLLSLALIAARVELPALFSERGINDFVGVQQAALQALGDDDAPTDLALQMDYRIMHLLVDEFQDVSVSQYRFFEKLTAGWSEDDGRTLFLVGDPMQSIYRFREAEVGKYLAVCANRCLGQVHLEPLTLTVNFRSRAPLVAWVNQCFKAILPKKQDITSGAVAFSAATAACDDGTDPVAVVAHPLIASEATSGEEARQIVEIIQAAASDQSIALLAHKRSQLIAIVAELRRAKIGFQAVDIEPLGERIAIQECLSLSRALLHLADRASWLAILRAPWCGLTLADLTRLAGDDHEKTVWQLMCDKARREKLSDDGRRRLCKINKVLAKALAKRRYGMFGRLAEEVWTALGAPATLVDVADIDNARTFFAALRQRESGGSLASFEELIETVDGLYAATDSGDQARVQIMTIHKAKGLEFDIVILPDLGLRSRRDDPRLLRWREQAREDGATDLLFAPIAATGEEDALYDYLKKLEAIRADHERARLLYVATTRARHTLHLFGSVRLGNEPSRDSLLAKLWHMVDKDYQILADRSAETAVPAVSALPYSCRRLTANWSPPPKPPLPSVWRDDSEQEEAKDEGKDIEYAWASETIRCVGSVVHRALEIMARDGLWTTHQITAKHAWFRQLLQQYGITDDRIGIALRQVDEALCNTIQDERGRWIFSTDHQEARSEYALTGVLLDRIASIKIDRTFIDDNGTRWIVDYKTSRHENPADREVFLDRQKERHKKQLEEYATLIRGQDKRPIMLGLYFPLLQAWQEWEFLGLS